MLRIIESRVECAINLHLQIGINAKLAQLVEYSEKEDLTGTELKITYEITASDEFISTVSMTLLGITTETVSEGKIKAVIANKIVYNENGEEISIGYQNLKSDSVVFIYEEGYLPFERID
ncbi:MAG: hypothetical protein J6Q35_03110 [Rikenellaceae bacterium]|nr:hypothetical protein [Rikenellaceae bacterium]